MARSIPRSSVQPSRASAVFSTSRTPTSLGVRGNRQLDETLSSRTPNAPSDHSKRVTESNRNGKRKVVLNLLSDEDEDEDASPRQHPSAFASQRPKKLHRMPPLATAVSQGNHAAFHSAGTGVYESALRFSQPGGLEWRPFPIDPRVTFARGQAHSQGYQPQTPTFLLHSQLPPHLAHAAWLASMEAHFGRAPQTQQNPTKGVQAFAHGVDTHMARQLSPGKFVELPQDQPTPIARMRPSFHPAEQAFARVDPSGQHRFPALSALARASASPPSGPTRRTMAPERNPFARPHHDVNTLSQAQRGQRTVGGVPFVTVGPSAPYQPTHDMLFYARATANTNSTRAQAGREYTTSDPRSSSNVTTGVQASFKTKQEVDKEFAGTKRSAESRQNGARKSNANFDESHFDGNSALSSSSRVEKRKLENLTTCGSRLEIWKPYLTHSQNGSASTSQETKTQSQGQTSAAPFCPAGNVPEATGVSVQSQQVVEPNFDAMAMAQRQDRPATTFLGMEGTHQIGPGSADQQERTAHSPERNDPTKSAIGVGKEQRIEERVHIPVVLSEDEVDHDGEISFEYAEDDSNSDDESSPANSHGKLRASTSGNKNSNTDIVSNQPSRVATLQSSTRALGLFQPPKDPSVPMGRDSFSRMPIEVRRRIYRELLKAKNSITVLKGWSQVYRRQQLDLHASILGVSKGHNLDANAVLYGENMFRYILRDDGKMVEFEASKKKDERTLPLKKQIDNLRHLMLEVEPNRMDLFTGIALYNAIEILVEKKATKLSRLIIDLSPRFQNGVQDKEGTTKDWVSQTVWFTRAQGMTNMLKQLKVHVTFFDIHLEENKYCKATSLRSIIDLRPEISDNEVSLELRKHDNHLKSTMSLEARRVLARKRVKSRLEEEGYKKLDMMDTLLEQAVLIGAPYMLRRGWFKELE
ncbi:hypothetical protein N0V82_001838 [Gnomoniopsis sp. IMI 355080]|nr:hypothetical protein N0V82_001838 [Gnomoniopsis sp. IMI 355080]